ncbi:hypothetical protein E2562_026086 [Oryza meyeriana var. granulata]|uniref:Uncharacterized protein n=1 Tax=Oryza meyeriana var. granulata TaxID=110450 RepID=A0A6G1EZ77_9ORYZ|nr:hypothetical protein E2562_026086 [Oryza meyeriana var. granulata]
MDDVDEVDMSKKRKKRILAKVVWYFLIIPWLKHLYANKYHTKMMRWHAEERKKDGMLQLPADVAQLRNIDRKYTKFASETRNVRFGLSTDGMNPFGDMSSRHNTWPVALCVYNLSSRLCIKRKYMMIPLIIQGPRQSGNNIDVYLKSLVEDLVELWTNGIQV